MEPTTSLTLAVLLIGIYNSVVAAARRVGVNARRVLFG